MKVYAGKSCGMHIFVAVEFMVSASAIAVILERADASIARAFSPTRARRQACMRAHARVRVRVWHGAANVLAWGVRACVRTGGRACANAACPGVPSGADLSAASSPASGSFSYREAKIQIQNTKFKIYL